MKKSFELYLTAYASRWEESGVSYNLNTYKPDETSDSAVLATINIDVDIPERSEAVQKIIEQLTGKKKCVLAAAQMKVTEIEEEIHSLLALPYGA